MLMWMLNASAHWCIIFLGCQASMFLSSVILWYPAVFMNLKFQFCSGLSAIACHFMLSGLLHAVISFPQEWFLSPNRPTKAPIFRLPMIETFTLQVNESSRCCASTSLDFHTFKLFESFKFSINVRQFKYQKKNLFIAEYNVFGYKTITLKCFSIYRCISIN